MNPIRTRLAAAAVGAGLAIATPTSAWAGPPRPVSSTPTANAADARRSIEDLRGRCIAAIEVRLPALAAARTAVSANRHVTDDHQAALTAGIDETSARLRVLAGLIRADSDLATMKEHCKAIFEDNRVFALVLPRARLVIGADTAADAGAKLGVVAARLADAIARAEAAGHDVSQARLDLDTMKARIASAVASAVTVAPAVLGLTPADWNADHEVLIPVRQALRSARADLEVARHLAGKIHKELKPPAASPGT